MGMCSNAEFSWGFHIPREQLVTLLRCLRKHDPAITDAKSESETVEQEEQPKPAKQSEKDADEKIDRDELDDYLMKIVEAKKFDGAFRYTIVDDDEFTYRGGDDGVEDVLIVHSKSREGAERPGCGNYGTTFTTLGTKLYDPEPAQSLVRQLEADLHLAEIGVELPLKEQWILSINIW